VTFTERKVLGRNLEVLLYLTGAGGHIREKGWKISQKDINCEAIFFPSI